MNKELASKIQELEMDYADHKPSCSINETQEYLIEVAEMAKKHGQRNFSLSASGYKCDCGYDDLVEDIKKRIVKCLSL